MSISVIISTYNRPDRLKQAIDSVIAQTFTDWELIIVDDHSDEDMTGYISSVNDSAFGDIEPKIRYIRLDKNFGCDTHPKNIGIKESKGDYKK
jgi:glycosyltransferase involved in cell wall biosynthesis